MYSTWDLIAACLVTAVGSHAVWIVPRWLDRRSAHRARSCTLSNPHNGPCNTREIHNDPSPDTTT